MKKYERTDSWNNQQSCCYQNGEHGTAAHVAECNRSLLLSAKYFTQRHLKLFPIVRLRSMRVHSDGYRG